MLSCDKLKSTGDRGLVNGAFGIAVAVGKDGAGLAGGITSGDTGYMPGEAKRCEAVPSPAPQGMVDGRATGDRGGSKSLSPKCRADAENCSPKEL